VTRVDTIVGTFKQPNGKPGFALGIPEEARCLFPPDKVPFPIISKGGIDNVQVSKPHSSGKLAHIHVTDKYCWTHLNPQPIVGSTVVIEVTELSGVRTYRI